MESGEHRVGNNVAKALERSAHRRVLAQCQMCSRLVVGMRRLIEDMRSEWRGLDDRITAFDDELAERARADDAARRLVTIPGIAGKTMRQLAADAGVGGSYFRRILRLSFLAPEVAKAVLRDRHPIELTAKRLANEVRLPISWDEQRALLGTR